MTSRSDSPQGTTRRYGRGFGSVIRKRRAAFRKTVSGGSSYQPCGNSTRTSSLFSRLPVPLRPAITRPGTKPFLIAHAAVFLMRCHSKFRCPVGPDYTHTREGASINLVCE